ncbi:LOW QUALITY PROTEIN: actin-related protein T2 [Leptosomus discolor]
MFDPSVLGVAAVTFGNGSGLLTAGIAGDSGPGSGFTAIAGCSEANATILGGYVRGEAQSRGVLSLNYPIDYVTVTCWDDVERIWRHVYEYELRIKAGERPMLPTPLDPLLNQEKMREIMFEGFMVPPVHFAAQATPASCASAYVTGTVMESGDGAACTVPMSEGYCSAHVVSRLDIPGQDITKYFMKLLLERGYTFVSTAEKEIVRDIRKKLCCAALDPIQEMKANKEIVKEYKLPDNNIIHRGNWLFGAQTLFTPASIGVEAPGVQKTVFNSIMKCGIDVCRNLYGSILFSGGSTLFPGLEEQILKELKLQVPAGMFVRIIAPPPETKYCVWIGASILTSFKQMWVTVSNYKDFGAAVIHQKSF